MCGAAGAPNFAESWTRQQVDDAGWRALLDALEREVRDWMAALPQRRDWDMISLSGAIGSMAHLACHLGAIRQLVPGGAGPPARD